MPFTDDPPTTKRRGGTTFLVDDHLAAMDEADAEGARRWLASPASPREVAAKFKAEGFAVSYNAVCNWREANGYRS